MQHPSQEKLRASGVGIGVAVLERWRYIAKGWGFFLHLSGKVHKTLVEFGNGKIAHRGIGALLPMQ